MAALAHVAALVATLWASPAVARPLTPAGELRLSTPERLALVGRIETQALRGETVRVLERRGAWVKVAVTDQPSPKNRYGYPGWMLASQLGTAPSNRPLLGDPVATAKRFLGRRYLWGGTSPYGFDCSGLTWYAYRAAGIMIPRDADAQFAAGKPASPPYEPGDLLFYGVSHVHHVGMYVGDGRMIESRDSASSVRISPVRTSDFAGARRYLVRTIASTGDVLQARYDAVRARIESGRAGAAELAELARVERADGRPAGWTGRLANVPLPRPGRARAERAESGQLAASLARIGRAYGGWAGFWIHDLSTGETAGWNSDASFPAGSTVKLGVLAASLRRFGPRASYDLRQLTGWSSNLAANRLVERLGGLDAVEDGLERLGMRSSTYPGPYRAGTSAAVDAPKPPPAVHWRLTTAHDLGRALYSIQAAAAGNRFVQARSGLTRAEARIARALLVGSSSSGENAGLLRPFLARIPVAQKNGWLSDARVTAAIVYRRRGPVIVVVEAYRPGITRGEAQELGRQVVGLLA